jgi:hypothetical protein
MVTKESIQTRIEDLEKGKIRLDNLGEEELCFVGEFVCGDPIFLYVQGGDKVFPYYTERVPVCDTDIVGTKVNFYGVGFYKGKGVFTGSVWDQYTQEVSLLDCSGERVSFIEDRGLRSFFDLEGVRMHWAIWQGLVLDSLNHEVPKNVMDAAQEKYGRAHMDSIALRGMGGL